MAVTQCTSLRALRQRLEELEYHSELGDSRVEHELISIWSSTRTGVAAYRQLKRTIEGPALKVPVVDPWLAWTDEHGRALPVRGTEPYVHGQLFALPSNLSALG